MSAALVDTDVVSLLYKRDSRAELYEPHLSQRIPAVSFMTIAELERWTMERNWGTARHSRLTDYLQQFVVLFADEELCRKWAGISTAHRRAGRPIQTADAWIAATAVQYRVPLITHNRSDYEMVDGLTAISAGS
jgi:predicted nucleic acid-binding protein